MIVDFKIKTSRLSLILDETIPFVMGQSKPKRGASLSKEFVQRERRNHSVPSSSQDLHGIAYNIMNIYIKKIHYYKLEKSDVFDILSVFFDVIYKF